MKKNAKPAKIPTSAPTPLAERDLTAVLGGTGGTIISQNGLPGAPEIDTAGWGAD